MMCARWKVGKERTRLKLMQGKGLCIIYTRMCRDGQQQHTERARFTRLPMPRHWQPCKSCLCRRAKFKHFHNFSG